MIFADKRDDDRLIKKLLKIENIVRDSEYVGDTPRIAMASCVLLLVPGYPLINSISDMVKGYINTGLARGMYALLRPGGTLWLQTPNIDSWGYREFGADWRALDPPRHLCLFQVQGLCDTLRLELAGTGIHVSLIEPGPIESGFRPNALQKFLANVDIEASAHRDSYQKQLARLKKAGHAAPFTLPGTAVLNFQPRDENYEPWIAETVKYLQSMSGVERVVANPLREELAKVWRSVSRQIMLPTICLLAGVLALVVGNTIRLTLVARATEIEILQLIGAENWYIRLPLLSSGSTLGFLGGLLGLGMLSLVHWQLKGLYLPPLVTHLQFLPSLQIIILVAIPTIMGFAGSYIAVRRPVREPTDPEIK